MLRSHRWRTAANSAAYLVPSLHSGQSVLDIGCGPGTIYPLTTSTSCPPIRRYSTCPSFAWYPLLPGLDDWSTRYRQVARTNGGEPDAGRRLVAWAREAGLIDIRPTASTWCYSAEPDRRWWGELWAARVLESDLAATAVEKGLATPDSLETISRAWLSWADSDDGWFAVPHGEILASPQP